MDSSFRNLKQSGLDEKHSENKPISSRYPSQYEDNSIRSEINDQEIANYVKRAATNAANNGTVYSCTNGVMCDIDTTIEDCPNNQCYNKYLDPVYDMLNINDFDPNKRIFYNQMKDIISTSHAGYGSDTDVKEKDRLDELLGNKNIPCDYNQMERQAQLQDLQKAQRNQGVCNGSNPNACDQNVQVLDCPNRECYKKYLSDLNITKKVNTYNPQVGIAHTKQYESGPAVSANDYKKKYNTLVVNSDVVVPDFIDVLVVMSETPIKIMLPPLYGPKIESTVGKVSSISNLLIKNLSLCSHQIVTDGKNKIDTVRSSVAVEPAGKKTFGAIHDTWILL
jgi:hypothetical protein